MAEQLTIIRHGESSWNSMKANMRTDSLWQEFVKQFDRRFDSEETFRMARELREKYRMTYGDHDTPLSPNGERQAELTGKALKEIIGVPDIIYLSPYDRTAQTLEHMTIGWPDLSSVKTLEDERLREQEHCLALLYTDWRIFYAFHPEQKEMYELEGPYWYRYPQGESVPDVRQRNKLWVTTLIREFSEQEIMAVTHHLAILSMRAEFERLSERQFIDLDQHDKPVNCGVTIYRGNPSQGRQGRFVLEMYNRKLY